MGPITGGATIVLSGSVRANGLRRAALGAAIAGLGTCAYAGFAWWSLRTGVLHPGGSADVPIGIAILIAIAAAAGLVSGRFRDAPASWAAAVIGGMLAEWVNYTIFPGWPTSDSGFWGTALYAAVFLFPIVVGGHLLGAIGAGHALRRAKARG